MPYDSDLSSFTRCCVHTNGTGHGESEEEGVGERPRLLSGVGVDPGLHSLVELILELDQPLPGRALPVQLVHGRRLVPQDVQEVSPHPLHTCNKKG